MRTVAGTMWQPRPRRDRTAGAGHRRRPRNPQNGSNYPHTESSIPADSATPVEPAPAVPDDRTKVAIAGDPCIRAEKHQGHRSLRTLRRVCGGYSPACCSPKTGAQHLQRPLSTTANSGPLARSRWALPRTNVPLFHGGRDDVSALAHPPAHRESNRWPMPSD